MSTMTDEMIDLEDEMIDLEDLDFTPTARRSAAYTPEPDEISDEYIAYLEASLADLGDDSPVVRQYYEHRLFLAQHGHSFASAGRLML